MTRIHLLPLFLACLISGCSTVQRGSQTAEVRAEQTLTIALAAVDSFLAFELRRRAEVPESVRKVAASVRASAPQAFQSANRLRLTYKLNRSAENEANLLTALALVESIVGEVRVWVPASSAGTASPLGALIREAEASKVQTTASWTVLIPVFVDLAREIYATVNKAREAARQDAEWTAVQDADFATRLSALTSSPHWQP